MCLCMSDVCLRPGCTTKIDTIGVCLSCANSSYKPGEDGVQFRDEHGKMQVTEGWDTEVPTV